MSFARLLIMNMCGTVFRLKCTYQTYAWGKLGASSEVAKLLQSADASFVPSQETAYAEVIF